MEKDKLFEKAATAGNSVKSFLSRAKDAVAHTVDINEDGAVDFGDLAVAAEAIGDAVKSKTAEIKENKEVRSRETELKKLRPIFAENIEGTDFSLPKLIRVADMDKAHAESNLCKGSVGFYTEHGELHIVNIFRDNIDAFRLQFYPDLDSELYYIDPSDRDHYIALDKYFTYLKIMRVNELQKIAQDLGATHFRVLYKEKNASMAVSKKKGKAKAKGFGMNSSAEAEHEYSDSEKYSVEIAAENRFLGCKPKQPVLRFLRNEPAIQNLISMRMNEASPTSHESFSLALSNSSGMKEKDAAKIDAALKSMKFDGSFTMVEEVRKESQRYFEYEIDF